MSIIGVGTYGTLYDLDKYCIKIFKEGRDRSFFREFFNLVTLRKIIGVSELHDILLPIDNNYYGLVFTKYKCTLKDWINNTKYSHTFNDKLEILKGIIEILQQIHNSGFIHADLKLENIMLSFDNKVKIIDWGLSGPIGHALIKYTTDNYNSHKKLNHYSHDIYSLGIIFIEILLESVMYCRPNYHTYKKMLNSSNLPSALISLILSMIHPEIGKLPSINTVSKFLNIPIHNIDKSSLFKPLAIKNKISIFPSDFKNFLLAFPNKIDLIIFISNIIYNIKEPLKSVNINDTYIYFTFITQ